MSKYQQLTKLQQQIYDLIVLEGTKTKDIALIRIMQQLLLRMVEKFGLKIKILTVQ